MPLCCGTVDETKMICFSSITRKYTESHENKISENSFVCLVCCNLPGSVFFHPVIMWQHNVTVPASVKTQAFCNFLLMVAKIKLKGNGGCSGGSMRQDTGSNWIESKYPASNVTSVCEACERAAFWDPASFSGCVAEYCRGALCKGLHHMLSVFRCVCVCSKLTATSM